MTWTPFQNDDDLKNIIEQSYNSPQVIFKHSTRCSISSMAKNRLDKEQLPLNSTFHYLDLIAHRSLSGKVAETFKVTHESPQVLVIKNGDCVYDESHSGIRMAEIEEQLATP